MNLHNITMQGRRMGRASCLLILAAFGVILPLDVCGYVPISPPSWAGEPGRVRHVYVFPEADATPSPDVSTNLFGEPGAVVTLGSYASGWQDPEDPMASSGEPGSGAWDLGRGPEGAIRITVPIGNAAALPGFGSYRVKLKINVVGYASMTALPVLSVEGYSLTNLVQTDSVAFADPFFGSWKNRTWTAQLEAVRENAVTLIVSAHASLGSTLDAIEIYALAETIPPEKTTLGTPVAWYQSFKIVPEETQTWSDADYGDNDGDGMLNGQEYTAGTDPTNSESLLKIVKIKVQPGEPPSLEWIGGTSGPVAPYVIESTTSLSAPDWQPLGTRARVQGLNAWTGSVQSVEGPRFFRIIAPLDSPP